MTSVEFDPAIFKEALERLGAIQRVADRLGQLRCRTQLPSHFLPTGEQPIHNRPRLRPTQCVPLQSGQLLRPVLNVVQQLNSRQGFFHHRMAGGVAGFVKAAARMHPAAGGASRPGASFTSDSYTA